MGTDAMAELATPSIHNPDGLALLEVLFPPGSTGLIETRCLRDGHFQRRFFVSADAHCEVYGVSSTTAQWDVFVGAAPRSRKEGEKDAVIEVWAAWIDIDSPNGAERLSAFPLKPSLVVASGTPGHVHAYWGLREAADPATIERINRALAERIGGDPTACDASHTMRLPGTLNCKHGRLVRSKVLQASEHRIALEPLVAGLDLNRDSSDGSDAAPTRHSASAMRDAALACAERGWRTFPVNEDKSPATKHGFKDASSDPGRIREMWRSAPEAGVGIRTGAASGLVVLDVDPKSGGDETLYELEAVHGHLPETIEVLTGGGGRHLYFRHPGGEVRCSAGKLGPGLDIRADGGYVVAPPSRHPRGGTYEWEVSHLPEDTELAEAPVWITSQQSADRRRSQWPSAR